MKKYALIAAVTIVLLSTLPVFAAKYPAPVGYVNDFANILSAQQRQELEAILQNFEKETSNEVVVAITPSFNGLDRFTYSQELFTEWGIGKESRNNGILFLIGPKDDLPFPGKGEAFINVGRGLEGALPDSVTGSILRNEVFPLFKDGKFYDGVVAGSNAIISATKGEYTAVPENSTAGGDFPIPIDMIMIGGFFLITYMASFLGRTKSWWLGGVMGGVGGAILGGIFIGGIAILGTAGILAFMGFIFDYIVSKNYQDRVRSGKKTDFWHSGGGFWWGGGGRGGFGGGGGFGGFGGGGSGGGGAGGSW